MATKTKIATRSISAANNWQSSSTCLRYKYGSVHTFWFGPMRTVNICDYATAVDAMVKKGSAFANRNLPYMFRAARGNRGILVSNGPLWQEQRRFALHTLRNFGLGRNIIEERIMYEFEIACEELEKRLAEGKFSIDPDKMFDLLVGNIINRMLFTDRFEKVTTTEWPFLQEREGHLTFNYGKNYNSLDEVGKG
ncbi:hypothetical protein ANCDUO_09981 [Ancylostoma duodenale]|uniref:Unspecific monooxygenase n=1 Tax=Ancylostoma duodenale TaxID=51022 RepID=A0A0C2GLE6_9BILA|nr:hypothetical protein ANCDUO_09981 [Ancylostoma duodenale]